VKAIIPVAGVGSRLRPHTNTLPKVLMNVAGKSIIGHIIDSIISAGVDELILIVGHLGDMVRDMISQWYPDLKITYVEQPERHGLGHAIYLAEPYIDMTQPVCIILGDTIFRADFNKFLREPTNVIGVKEVDDPRRFGVAMTKNGTVYELIEKPADPKSNLALIGMYRIQDTKALFDTLAHMIQEDHRTKGEIQLTDALQLMLAGGAEMKTFTIDKWLDCGKPETLLSTNHILLEEFANTTRNKNYTNCIIHQPVYIDPTASVSDSVIGPNVTIAAHATVRFSIISESLIHEDAFVSNMILFESLIGTKAVLKGSRMNINIGDSSNIDFTRHGM